MCQSNTTNFYYVLYCIRATCFVLRESSSGPSKKKDPYLEMLSIFLERTEDDYIRIETCCPNTIKKT